MSRAHSQELYHTFLKLQIPFYGLNCVPQIYMLKFESSVPQNVTVFGDRLFKEVIKLK